MKSKPPRYDEVFFKGVEAMSAEENNCCGLVGQHEPYCDVGRVERERRSVTIPREVAKQALEALRQAKAAMTNDWYDKPRRDMVNEHGAVVAAIEALKAAGVE